LGVLFGGGGTFICFELYVVVRGPPALVGIVAEGMPLSSAYGLLPG